MNTDVAMPASIRRVITTDSHLIPPPWLLNELPARLRDVLSSQLVGYEERDGQRYLKMPGARHMLMQGRPAETHVGPVNGSLETLVKALNSFDGVDATPWFDPVGRLKDMRRENVVAAVLIGNPSMALRRSPADVEAQVAYCRLVNDWQVETYKDYLNVFAPGIYLPFLDPAACVVELERCAAKGLRPGVLPDAIWDSPYTGAEWEPLWEAANALEMPLTLHISGLRHRSAEKGSASPSSIMAGFYGGSVGIGETLAMFSIAGLFQKYPKLHLVMTEGAAFWLAGLLRFLDHYWAGRYGRMLESRFAATSRKLEMRPSDYIRRQGHATFMYDPIAIRLRDETGVECLMWGNDYPHTEGLFPDSQLVIEEQFEGVSEIDIEKITYSNAAKIFRFVP
jgi:predicted TIM-barrel fold metal-dependent hydrolase